MAAVGLGLSGVGVLGLVGVSGFLLLRFQSLLVDGETTKRDLDRLTSFFSTAGAGLGETDGEGLLLDVNPAGAELLGLEANQPAKVSLVEAAHPEDRAELRRLFREITDGTIDAFRTGKRYQMPAGAWRWVELSAVAGGDSNDRRIAVVIQDADEHYRVEALLRDREATLSALLENTDGCLWSVDRDLNLVAGNLRFRRRFRRLTGGAPQPGEPLPIQQDRDVDQELEGYLRRALEGDSFRVERWSGLGNHRRYFELRFRPIAAKAAGQRQVVGVAAAGFDLTAQRRSEHRLRRQNERLAFANRFSREISANLRVDTVLATALEELSRLLQCYGASIWRLEEGGTVLECRQATGVAGKLLKGWRLAIDQGIIGWCVRERQSVLVSDTRIDPRHYKAVDERNGVEIRALAYTPLIHQEVLIGVLSLADTRVGYFGADDLLLLETISGQLATAIANASLFDEAQRLRETAESASRAKSAFLANMSHELRTPLNAMLGHAQLLQRDPSLTAAQKRAIETIQRSGDRLLLLVNEVLDSARLEAGDLELFAEPTNLRALFGSLVEQSAALAGQKGLQFHWRPGAGIPDVAIVDEKRLRQILSRLLDNAVRFTEQGSVIFEAEFRDGRLEIRVTDTGVGIESERIGELFVPFGQGGERYRNQGKGLGLALAKGLVECMGGALEVRSQRPGGSCFSLSLPLQAKAGAVDRTLVEAPPKATTVVGYRRADGLNSPYRLLVVDDLAVSRHLLRGLLLPLGFQVIEAASGEDALHAACDQRPDLILMDIAMPGMDGLEATRRIRGTSACSAMKVVAMSASTFPDDRSGSLAAGCLEHLPKPIPERQLLDALARWLALEWVDAAPEPALSGTPEREATPASSGDASALPAEVREELLQLVRKGNILALRERLAGLQAEDGDNALLSRLRDLAERLQMKAIRALLE